MLTKIISGGQTGADIAGIDAAINVGFSYGGWLPRGRKNQEGGIPESYDQFSVMTKGGYPMRTEKNVVDSDGTVIFHNGPLLGGSKMTRSYARKHNKPFYVIDTSLLSINSAAAVIDIWIEKHNVRVLNVAGSSAQKDPLMYAFVYSCFRKLLLKHKTQFI